MKILIFLLTAFIFLSCSTLHKPPTPLSDIEQYCKKIYGDREGSKRAMMTCLQHERSARIELSKITIPVEVAEYCRQLSSSTGGSYSVMLTCVNKELLR